MTVGRWLALGVLLLAVVFGFRGGMFTVGDARALGREEEALQAEIKSLHRQVDSLRSFHDSLETSPVVQERVAREEWGVIRPGEMSIRLERGDSGGR
ncbi:MAG: septum formation initiator family protein [Gemmatimonadetes bacterium]|nr:septum formation initiator family protein [Gemmatimonadota bacterium]MBL0180385.1 septum formation initiator family protein [Gemmatimonadota bacterium]